MKTWKTRRPSDNASHGTHSLGNYRAVKKQSCAANGDCADIVLLLRKEGGIGSCKMSQNRAYIQTLVDEFDDRTETK